MKTWLSRVGGSAFIVGSLVGLAATSSGGCAGKKNTQLMLAVETDVRVPKDLNVVTIDVESFGANQFHQNFPVGPDGTVRLPATLGIVPQDPTNLHPVTIKITGKFVPVSALGPLLQDGVIDGIDGRVIRASRVSFAVDRVALVRMPLHFSCFDVTDCKSPNPDAPMTCVAGQCVSADLKVEDLPTYSPQAVAAPAPPGSGNSVCFDGDTCMASATQLPAPIGDGCTFVVSAGGSDSGTGGSLDASGPGPSDSGAAADAGAHFASFNADTLTIGFENRLGGLGFCSGDGCRVPLNQDKDEGWFFTDASKTTISLAPGICARYKAGKLGAVCGTDRCATKTVSLPLCDTSHSVAPSVDAGSDASATDGGSDGAVMPDAGADVGADGSTGGDAGGGCVPIPGACLSCMESLCPSQLVGMFGPGYTSGNFTGGSCSAYVGCVESLGCSPASMTSCGPSITPGCSAGMTGCTPCAAPCGAGAPDGGPPPDSIALPDACISKTCADLGFNCNPAADGCGGMIASCGTCSGAETCIANHCTPMADAGGPG